MFRLVFKSILNFSTGWIWKAFFIQILYLLSFSFLSIPLHAETNASVAAGENHSLLLRTDGSLWSMGKNDRGQRGDGSELERGGAAGAAAAAAARGGGAARGARRAWRARCGCGGRREPGSDVLRVLGGGGVAHIRALRAPVRVHELRGARDGGAKPDVLLLRAGRVAVHADLHGGVRDDGWLHTYR